MPPYRSKTCCAHHARPVVKRPKKVLNEEEKAEAKVKREINKALKDKRVEWEATLPGPWREGAAPFRHLAGTHVMFKSDAKKAFTLTEREILTLRHESIPASPKTYFAVADVRALQRRNSEPQGNWRVLKATTSSGRRKKANFWEFYNDDAGMYERWYGLEGRISTAPPVV
ncbi:hypothetical protein C8R46DRAFT_1048810 [Mycena filopes]|nr:hypothetical protein C8R46DRAFT_1048810 [Mycena filopes]